MPKISALLPAGDVNGNETVVMVKDGQTRRGPLGDLVDAAIAPHLATAAASANTASAAAELAQLAALLNDNVFPDADDGVAGTPEGETFFDEDLAFYRKQGGLAVLKALLVTASRLGLTTPEMANAVGDGAANDRAALDAANALGKITLINKAHYVATDVDLDCIKVGPGAMLIPGPGATITIGEVTNWKTRRQFIDLSEGGSVVFADGIVRPDWFGDGENTVHLAVESLPATGGDVYLGAKTYKPNNHIYGLGGAAGKSQTRANVTFHGTRMPVYSGDCSSLVNGTVVQGSWLVFQDNVEFRDMGFDSGKNVVDYYNGGAVQPGGFGEGLLATFPNDATKNALPSPTRRGLKLHNIRCLSPSPTAPVHALILGEGYVDVHCTGVVEGCYGLHPGALKCASIFGEVFKSYLGGGEGMILKSDAQATAVAQKIQFDKLHLSSNGPPGTNPHVPAGTGFGLMINPIVQNVSLFQVGEVYIEGFQHGYIVAGQGATFGLDGWSIGSLIVDGSVVSGVELSGNPEEPTSFVNRGSIGYLQTRNCGVGLSCNTQTLSAIQIGSFYSVNCPIAGDFAGNASPIIGSMIVQNSATGAIRCRGNARPSIGSLSLIDTETRFVTAGGGLAPVLLNGATELPGNGSFTVDFAGGKVVLCGHVIPAAGQHLIGRVPFFAVPASPKRVYTQGKAIGAEGQVTPVPVTIGTNGDIYVNEYTPGYTANCGEWVSLTGISWTLGV